MNETIIKTVKQVVIVGGGSAGWLAAGVLAAEYAAGDDGLQITLIESPDVPSVGVGEGTWPTMRGTLKRMGISETEFLLRCDASFKQGSRFFGWCRDGDGTGADEYIHPFTAPAGFQQYNSVPHWMPHRDEVPFADAVCPQGAVSRLHLAPKQLTTPEYAFNLNYGYHLDAGKFAEFLREFCTGKLGVSHIRDRVVRIENDSEGYIRTLHLESGAALEGDLFVDCSGSASLLLGAHYGIGLSEQRSVLFNDSALAVQVPYSDADSPIASCTHSSARAAGWIWDIGLPTRRGVGYTYSSAHTDEGAAERVLRDYIAPALGGAAAETADVRRIRFSPGYRHKFWHKNCVAMGMAAGFIEPLEASALVLIEQSATLLADQLPPTRHLMDAVAARFNRKMSHHWRRVIDFLKLHYALSARNADAYWRDHREDWSVPDTLRESMEAWRYRAPWQEETEQADDLFPAASYQYVLYGMGFVTESLPWGPRPQSAQAVHRLFYDNLKNRERLERSLPGNRELLAQIRRAADHNNQAASAESRGKKQ